LCPAQTNILTSIMGEQMHFKLFLKLDHKEVEVRRFSCEVNTDYDGFRHLVKNAFDQLPYDDFLLKWEDEDGDKVAISSDEEFKFALSQPSIAKDVFRMDVEIFENPWWKQMKRGSERTWANCTGDEHPGIQCNCCQQQVRGFRYKCLSCVDVNICGSCEDKGMHPAHDMIRISTIKSVSNSFFENVSRLYDETMNRTEAIPKVEIESNIIKGEIELVLETPVTDTKESNDLMCTESTEEDDIGEEVEVVAELKLGTVCTELPKIDYHPENCIPEYKTFNNDKIEICSEIETLNNSIKVDTTEDDNEKACIDKETSDDSFNCSKPHGENKTLLTKEELESFETNTEITKDKNISSQEPTRNLQEEIESLLAPMTPLPDLESVSNIVKVKTIDETNKNLLAPEKSVEKEFISERVQFSFPPDKKSKDLENSAIASSSSFGTGSIHSCLENSLRKLEDTMKNTSTKFEEYGDTDAHDEEQPVNNDLTGSSCIKSVERDVQVKKCLPEPQLTPAPKRHYNPRIANALDQMIAMGFSDNDGWLTELLVRKHGDIVQVLDILSPVSK